MFDEAERIFGTGTGKAVSTDKTSTSEMVSNRSTDIGLLMYHIEHFNGIVVLCTNVKQEIDQSFFRRIKFFLEFPMPGVSERKRLWQAQIPSETPIAKEGLNFDRLATSFKLSGGFIRSAVIRAAAKAALNPPEERFLTQLELESAAQRELQKLSEAGEPATSYYSWFS